jgi:hypothetical protein
MLDDQGNATVFHRFPCIIMRVEPCADNTEKETMISPIPAGRCDFPDIGIHVSACLFHIGKFRKQFTKLHLIEFPSFSG